MNLSNQHDDVPRRKAGNNSIVNGLGCSDSTVHKTDKFDAEIKDQIHPRDQMSFEESCTLLESHLHSVQKRLESVIEECRLHMTELVGMASTNAGQNAILGTYKQCNTSNPGRPVVYNKLSIKSNRLCRNLYNVEQKMRIVEQLLAPSENKVTSLLNAQMVALRISKECGQRAKLCSEMSKLSIREVPRKSGPVIYQPDVIRLNALRLLMPEIPHRQRICLNKAQASDARFEDWDIVDCTKDVPVNVKDTTGFTKNPYQRLAALLSMGTQTDLQTKNPDLLGLEGECITPIGKQGQTRSDGGKLGNRARGQQPGKIQGTDVVQISQSANNAVQVSDISAHLSSVNKSDAKSSPISVTLADKTLSGSYMNVPSPLPHDGAVKSLDSKFISEKIKDISFQNVKDVKFNFGQGQTAMQSSIITELSPNMLNISASSNESFKITSPTAEPAKYQWTASDNRSKSPVTLESTNAHVDQPGALLFAKTPSLSDKTSLFSGMFATSSDALDQTECHPSTRHTKTESLLKLDNTVTFSFSKSQDVEPSSSHPNTNEQLILNISPVFTTAQKPLSPMGVVTHVTTSEPCEPSKELPSTSVNFAASSITVEPLPQRTRSSLVKASLQKENQSQKDDEQQQPTTIQFNSDASPISLVIRSDESIASNATIENLPDNASPFPTTMPLKTTTAEEPTNLTSCLSTDNSAQPMPLSSDMILTSPSSVKETLLFSSVKWSANSDLTACPPKFSFGNFASSDKTPPPPPTFTFGLPSKPSDATKKSPFSNAQLSTVIWPSSTKADIALSASNTVTTCSSLFNVPISTTNMLGILTSQTPSTSSSPRLTMPLFCNFAQSITSSVSTSISLCKEDKTLVDNTQAPLFGANTTTLFGSTTSNSGVLASSPFQLSTNPGLSSVNKTGIFGAAQTAIKSSQASLFGNSPFAQHNSSAFSSVSTTKPATSVLFGAFKSSPFSPSFGSTSNVGVTTQIASTTTTSMFGSSNSNSLFGSVQSNLFQNPVTVQTTKPDSVPVFKFASQGAPFGNPQSSSIFGGSTGTLFPTSSQFAVSSSGGGPSQMKPLFATTTTTSAVSGLFGSTTKPDPFNSGKSGLFGAFTQVLQPQTTVQALFGSTTSPSALFSSGCKGLFANCTTTASSSLPSIFDGSKPVALFGKQDSNAEVAREQVRSKYSGASFTSFRE